jgi:hypothetical protein
MSCNDDLALLRVRCGVGCRASRTRPYGCDVRGGTTANTFQPARPRERQTLIQTLTQTLIQTPTTKDTRK